jgi:uncharacterized OB-fold protein
MPGKVIPQPDDLNLELFRAIASTGEMHVQQCAACGAYAHPPRYYCGRCFSPRHRMRAVSGAGTVYSHTLSYYTTEPAWKDDVPYATVVVELDEGPRIVGAARHPDPAAIRIGQRVRVVPEPRTDEFSFLTVEFDGVPVPGSAVAVGEEAAGA